MKYALKNLAIGLAVLVLLTIALELGLRVYNPFTYFINGYSLMLPKGKTFAWRNDHVAKADTLVTYRFNNVGFRGEDLPHPDDQRVRVLALGSSNTACKLLSDGHDWPALVAATLKKDCPNIWLNNAGFDGFTTLGSSLVFNAAVDEVKPDIVVFMIGTVEDIPYSQFQEEIAKADKQRSAIDKSRLLMVGRNVINPGPKYDIDFAGFAYDPFKAGTVDISDSTVDAKVQHQLQFIPDYKKGLSDLMHNFIRRGMQPVLITCPNLMGDVTDPATNVYLGNIKVNEHDIENGKMFNKLTNLYSDAGVAVANENNIPIIDVRNELPKNSIYYIDHKHFSIAGAQKMSEIIGPKLLQIIKDKGYCGKKVRH